LKSGLVVTVRFGNLLLDFSLLGLLLVESFNVDGFLTDDLSLFNVEFFISLDLDFTGLFVGFLFDERNLIFIDKIFNKISNLNFKYIIYNIKYYQLLPSFPFHP